MGRKSPRFSREQREAAVQAVLAGLSPRRTAEAAAAGKLGLEPFEPAASTIQDWVASHRRREGVELSGQQEAQRVRAVAEKRIARVEAMEAPTAKDLHALREALRVVNATDRAAPRPAPTTGEMSSEDRALLERVTAAMHTPPEPNLHQVRHQLGQRWVRAQVSLEKPKGGAWWKRSAGRPWRFEQEWRKAATDHDRRKVLARERVELEKFESAASESEPKPLLVERETP